MSSDIDKIVGRINEQAVWEETARLYNTFLVPTCTLKLTGEVAKTLAENGDIALQKAYESVYMDHVREAEGPKEG